MKTRLPFLLHSPVLFSLLAATLLVHNTQAQITVTTLTDENDTPAGAQVSLREAVRDVATGGQITFNAALKGKVLLVTAGEMTVAGKTVTVAAPDGLTIDAHGLSRIFNVAAGAGLNLSGLTLQGGKAPAEGGAIVNGGALSLTDCVLRDNRAGEGTTGAPGPPNQNLPGYPGGQGGPGSNGGAVSNIGSLSALRCYFAGNVAGTVGTGGAGVNVKNTFGSYSGGAGVL